MFFQLMESQLSEAVDAPVSDLAAAVICFSSYYQFYKLSYEKRPVSCLLTFVSDNVSISISIITIEHSLLLTSYTRITIGESYDALSTRGVIRGCHVPLNQPNGLGSFLFAGNLIVRESGTSQPNFLIALPFWLEPNSTFGSS
jgi:hypothetical protein